MRELPSDLQNHLNSGATTLARCWRITRTDGVVQGFTDHDQTLVFGGVFYEAESGLTPGAIETATGLAPDTHEVSGALRSTTISEADIIRGRYDGAEVAVFLVNWQDVSSRVLSSRGYIGEIQHSAGTFEAEIVGLSDRLNQPLGRAFLHSCDCRLGDVKCGVDLNTPTTLGTGTISALVDPQHYSVDGLSGFAAGWFTNGSLTWLNGANAGLASHVKVHLASVHESTIELWLSPPMLVQPGDQFSVSAGCDKTAKTCAAKFDNILNFRGFPFIPGDDVASSYPSTGGAHDGGSLFRT